MPSNNFPDIYHGWLAVYENGTRCIIQDWLGEKCITPTDYPFWKRSEDVESKVETMAGEI